MEPPPEPAEGAFALEVGIVSRDPARLSDFYGQALGFAPQFNFTTEAGTVYRLRNGRAWLKIFRPAGEPAPSAGEALGGREGVRYFTVYVDELDPALERSLAAGATLLRGPFSHRPGARAALVTDPDGNLFEILQDDIERSG